MEERPKRKRKITNRMDDYIKGQTSRRKKPPLSRSGQAKIKKPTVSPTLDESWEKFDLREMDEITAGSSQETVYEPQQTGFGNFLNDEVHSENQSAPQTTEADNPFEDASGKILGQPPAVLARQDSAFVASAQAAVKKMVGGLDEATADMIDKNENATTPTNLTTSDSESESGGKKRVRDDNDDEEEEERKTAAASLSITTKTSGPMITAITNRTRPSKGQKAGPDNRSTAPNTNIRGKQSQSDVRKPYVRPILDSMVPTTVRQKYLESFITECMKISSGKEAEAFNRAEREEANCFHKSTSRVHYLELIRAVITKLRAETAINQDEDMPLLPGASSGQQGAEEEGFRDEGNCYQDEDEDRPLLLGLTGVQMEANLNNEEGSTKNEEVHEMGDNQDTIGSTNGKCNSSPIIDSNGNSSKLSEEANSWYDSDLDRLMSEGYEEDERLITDENCNNEPASEDFDDEEENRKRGKYVLRRNNVEETSSSSVSSVQYQNLDDLDLMLSDSDGIGEGDGGGFRDNSLEVEEQTPESGAAGDMNGGGLSNSSFEEEPGLGEGEAERPRNMNGGGLRADSSDSEPSDEPALGEELAVWTEGKRTKKKQPAKILACRGFSYRVNKTVKSISYLNCVESSTSYKCSAKCKVRDNRIVFDIQDPIEHSHTIDFVYLEVKKMEEDALQAATENLLEGPSQVYARLYAKILESKLGQAGLGHITSEESFARKLLYRRTKSNNIPRKPKTIGDIQIPDSDRLTSDGREFMIFEEKYFNEKGEARYVSVFISPAGVKLLNESSTWYGDGCCSSVKNTCLHQIYVFMTRLRTENSVPAAYALCSNKDGEIYLKIFRSMKQQQINGPENLIIDFEPAVLIGLRQVFPETVVFFCSFHFKRAISCKAKELGLNPDVEENVDINLFLRKIWCLLCVPAESVITIYERYIKKSCPYKELDVESSQLIKKRNDSLTTFLNYFEKQFIGTPLLNARGEIVRSRPRFQIKAWNKNKQILDAEPTDTNFAEAFNSSINKRMKAKGNIYKIIKQFKTEEALTRSRLSEANRGIVPVHKKRKQFTKVQKKRQQLQTMMSTFNPANPEDTLNDLGAFYSTPFLFD